MEAIISPLLYLLGKEKKPLRRKGSRLRFSLCPATTEEEASGLQLIARKLLKFDMIRDGEA